MDRPNTLNGEKLQHIRTPIPGPRTRELTAALRSVESRNVTYVDARFPVFWESASGAIVTDVDENRYIDLTAGFGVANTGHSNPAVAQAIARQAKRLMHAMGDVHPAEVKTQLLEKLALITPGNLQKTFLASTGSEAVEAAMKTAIMATGKSTFLSFRGAYHGLSLGALEVSGIEKFRDPFKSMLPCRTVFLDFPAADANDPNAARTHLAVARKTLETNPDIAAVIIEPVQARGGNFVAAPGYLRALREICTALGVLLIFDEIYTGFGRTGTMFACDADGAVPDIICIGKAMANGFPISAAVASPQVMDAWPESPGEALHTSTYLGNPMACAAAIANIGEVERLDLPARARALGDALEQRLEGLRSHASVRDVRGRGLLWGIQLSDGETAARVVKEALRAGVIVLQAGPAGDVLSITPPLVISEQQLFAAIDVIADFL
ncbi:MAG TPA: aspartate aminotransferase family protein [Candidatus Baltobacteraceae bacterium]|jgi:4-aminobutyrate aminotransferase-like enzyme|nr:aspartate aminotransferase family protein [Candidatus Baltobacteraceae bacterium]